MMKPIFSNILFITGYYFSNFIHQSFWSMNKYN